MAGHEESLEDQLRRMVVSGHRQAPRVPQATVGQQQSPQSLNDAPNGRPPVVPPHLKYSSQQIHAAQHGPPGLGNVYAPGTHPHLTPIRQQYLQQPPIDPPAFRGVGQVGGYYQQQRQQPHQLYGPIVRRGPLMNTWNDVSRQANYLDHLAASESSKVDMSQAEAAEKEDFRATLESAIHGLCAADDRLPKVSLECFGSFRSGFATGGSDMDLVIVLQDNLPSPACFSLLEDDLPRALEKRLLNMGYGARLLTRTRVPIIKICEKPNECLLNKLRAERYRWEALPNEKKYPHVHQNGDDEALAGEEADLDPESTPTASGPAAEQPAARCTTPPGQSLESGSTTAQPDSTNKATLAESSKSIPTDRAADSALHKPQPPKRENRPFTRERKAGPLDFPKDGVGVQCDINFFNPLGLHNTQLLRCYGMCDPRVRPMVLFVKAWAKRRKINSSYSGTLSSYGYVLMVLHYLVNVADPPVLPNLQMPWRPNPSCTPQGATRTEVDGHIVDFWRNENEIIQAVRNGQMSSSRESLGSLLSGFFRYYSSQGGSPQLHWMQDVLSLRTPKGLLNKAEKGWVKAITEDGEGKRVQHRYLLCIEDPFETTHNVARTVTHQGIVAIRDEFRRAYRILQAVGQAQQHEDLFAHHLETEDFQKATAALKQDTAAQAQAVDAQTDLQKTLMRNQAAFTQNRSGNTQRPSHRQRRRGKGRGITGGQQHQQAPSPPNTADEDAFPTLDVSSRRGTAGVTGASHRGRGSTRSHNSENAAPVTRRSGFFRRVPVEQATDSAEGALQ